MWRNGGHGGSRQKGDGDRYCDMRGTGSGETLKKSRLNESIHLNFYRRLCLDGERWKSDLIWQLPWASLLAAIWPNLFTWRISDDPASSERYTLG
jgi:hypothetical protein